jgi:zinc and cadmium transporter
MSSQLLAIIAANLLVSSGSLVGVLTIPLQPKLVNKFLLPLVSLSAGTMLGAAFLHLLPESLETLDPHLALQLTLAAFIAFFLLERILHWRHCHDEQHLAKHTLGIMNLVGDSIHNFIDGLLIAASFTADASLGWVAVVAIALHEIPQEIGDFGVLLHSGFTRRRALIANVVVSMTAVLGGIVGFVATHASLIFATYLIPVAAGGFIYIAAADLIPELKEGKSSRKTLANIVTFVMGILIMALLGHGHQ